MGQTPVITRPVMKSDKDFIINSWLANNYYGNWFYNCMKEFYYNEEYHKYITKLLFKPETQLEMAVLADDPEMILGYAVFAKDVLYYIYVKLDYRGQGIATLLLKDKNIKYVTNQSKIGRSITKKKKLIFNPFLA